MQITSKTNNIVKYIKSLEDKKNRNKYNSFVVEGVKIVNEIVNSRGENPFEFIVYSKELLSKGSLGKDILRYVCSIENQETNEKFVHVSESIFEYIADTKTPQGILAVVKRNLKDLSDLIDALATDSSYIILDNIQDSGNLGTIIRSANSFGVKNIICTEGTADVYNPKVVRSTMGAILNTNITYVSKCDITHYLEKLKKLGYNIIGTRMEGATNIREIENISKAIFVMGNEANGLSKELEEICDMFAKIPMETVQESLNVGVAASIVMYEGYIRG